MNPLLQCVATLVFRNATPISRHFSPLGARCGTRCAAAITPTAHAGTGTIVI
jgi:hypothetical protein